MTNLNQGDTTHVKTNCIMRGKSKKLHCKLKDLTGREACQYRQAVIQISHIFWPILWRNLIKITVRLMGKAVD